MPDGSAPTPPHAATDADLHAAMVVLSAAEKYAIIAGLKGRSRDPREKPGTGGEQRDAAQALDEAHDAGDLARGRDAHRRIARLPLAAQATAWWLAEWGGAWRKGAVVTRDGLIARAAQCEAPVDLRAAVDAAAAAAREAAGEHASASALFRSRATAKNAAALNRTRGRADGAAAKERAARFAVDEWARDWVNARLTTFLPAWRATAHASRRRGPAPRQGARRRRRGRRRGVGARARGGAAPVPARRDGGRGPPRCTAGADVRGSR